MVRCVSPSASQWCLPLRSVVPLWNLLEESKAVSAFKGHVKFGCWCAFHTLSKKGARGGISHGGGGALQ